MINYFSVASWLETITTILLIQNKKFSTKNRSIVLGLLLGLWRYSQLISSRRTHFQLPQEILIWNRNPRIKMSHLFPQIWIEGCGAKCLGPQGNTIRISDVYCIKFCLCYALLIIPLGCV